MPSGDAAQLPSSEYGIHQTRAVSQKPFALPEGKFPDCVDVDVVANIEVGHGSAIILFYWIQDECTAVSSAVLKPRSVVHRFREGVIEVERESMSLALPQAERSGVIVRMTHAAKS